MRHTGCGGRIVEDHGVTYPYGAERVPALRCEVCGEEIIGDPEIEEEEE